MSDHANDNDPDWDIKEILLIAERITRVEEERRILAQFDKLIDREAVEH